MKSPFLAFLLFSLLSSSLFAQNYDKNWEKVVQLESEGKIKSAHQLVAKIFKKATSDKEEVQLIKCFFYQSKYIQILEEDAQYVILLNLQKQIKEASIPSKAILNLIYGKCLQRHLESTRRRNTSAVLDTEVVLEENAMDIAMLKKEIAVLNIQKVNTFFEKTLENESVLKATSLKQYQLIFDYLTLEKLASQNLLDYILNENILYYSGYINNWNISKTDFLIYTKELLGDSNSFLQLNFDFIEDPALKKTLLLYQKQEKNNPTQDNQWKRMLFCKKHLIDSDQAYLIALTTFQKKVTAPFLIEKIQLERADFFKEHASKSDYPNYNIQAVAILDSIIKTNSRSNAFKLAVGKRQNIVLKSLSASLQRYSYDQENTRAAIQYRNVDRLNVSFYKINQTTAQIFLETEERGSNKKDSLVAQIVQYQKPLASTNYALLNRNDYFEYSTEVLLPQLQTGKYLAYFESDGEQKDKKATTYQTITISNLSLLATVKNDSTYYTVLDRKRGKPMAGVTLKSPYFTIKTNVRGTASYKQNKEENYYSHYPIELTTEKDTVSINKKYISYSSDDFENEKEDDFEGKLELYLDRAIYRPGQTVYYKGIAAQKKKNSTRVVIGTSFKITIRDPNYSTLKEFDVTTNEFGSFSGEFVLPKNGINGNFMISVKEPVAYEKDPCYDSKNEEHPFWDQIDFEEKTTSFKVEEYKRPKFKVSFDPITQNIQVNQSVLIKGAADAFAGSSVSDAKVSYTITRYTNYFRNYYTNEQSEILVVSETKTDAFGKFTIDFVAKPSKNAVKAKLPVFNYRINATVMDLNGETHTEETTIKAGYHDLILTASIPQDIETKNKNEITLYSTNLNGEFKAAKGEIKLYFIRPFLNKFKPRVFSEPEIKTISDADFEKLFPYEINKDEGDEKPIGTLVFSKKVATDKDQKIALDFITNYKSGKYKLVFTANDPYNNTIETVTNFNITQSKDSFNASEWLTAEQINDDPKKDGFALLKLTSMVPELFILTTASYQDQGFFEDNFHLKNNETIIKIAIQKEFENNIVIGFQTIFENQMFSKELNVALKTIVPKLEFSVATFRNKIEPGNSENWSFKLNGLNTSTEAEVLASMYDSSLDQFTKTDWQSLDFEKPVSTISFKTSLGFEKTEVTMPNLNNYLNRITLSNEATRLIWFGFDFNQRYSEIQGIEYQKQLAEKIKKPKNAKLISGIVTDKLGEVLPGVAVFIKGTKRATTTDFDGYYQIEIVLKEELSFSYIGYENKSVTVVNFNNIDVQLNESSNALNEVVVTAMGIKREKRSLGYATQENVTEESPTPLLDIKMRKNLSETAFFYPNLRTDAQGKLHFNFTSPEALTAWKFRLLAHNKAATFGYLEKNIITQKELMIMPNFPRFFREKDTLVISAKISNSTPELKIGSAILQFFDANTLEPIDAKMLNTKNLKNFSITPLGSTALNWKIVIPEGLQGVHYKIVAKAGNFSDGEENSLPVLTNTMLVTESIPIWVRENSKKEYTFENLINNSSATLKNHQFTLEYTSNPSWMAIQSLPYLMEYEHECAEQTFARFYANALATLIIDSNPKIAAVFESWKTNEKLKSKLEENEELKTLILAETPWLNDAKSEVEKKRQLGLLFDLEKMKTSQETTFQKLKQKQKPSGGFAWFDGSDENQYITRHILAGLGHLSQLDKTEVNRSRIREIAKTGIPFLDQKFLNYYKSIIETKKDSEHFIWSNPHSDLHYLYTRSFYLEDHPLSDTLKKATKLYLETTKKEWLNYSLYEKGLAALTLNRFNEKETAKKIIVNLKETASNNEDWGMYWIANQSGWYWYQAPIETQALLIEAFAEITQDTQSVDAMKVWLLKNKQTKNWPSTKSTTEAVYALLLQGNDWLSVKDNTIIKAGNEKILTKKRVENEKEAQTGYLKLNWKAEEIRPAMATVSIENKSKVPGFGGIYWQYFEDLDKIKTNSGAVLSVFKELYIKKSTLNGIVLQKVTSQNSLKIGDLVTVRLLISSKEDMEFVHLKDMRASCFEPIDVLSGYVYESGLGFYKSTKDAATHFFFDRINKGTYVLEYAIRVNSVGDFSNGISSIESMYAPEFSSHTKGIRVKTIP